MVYIYTATRALDPDTSTRPDMIFAICRQDPGKMFYDNQVYPETFGLWSS